jgi:hypothetical protein
LRAVSPEVWPGLIRYIGLSNVTKLVPRVVVNTWLESSVSERFSATSNHQNVRDPCEVRMATGDGSNA